MRQEDWPKSTAAIFLDKGYCYGFPLYPDQFDIPILGKVKTLLQVRDIRDALVSRYYSTRNSHPTPGSAPDALKTGTDKLFGRAEMLRMDLDEGVIWLAEHDLGPRFRRLYLLAKTYPVRLFRYEDVVYDKAGWVAGICEHFGWDIPPERHRSIASQHDVFPTGERPNEHIRQVHPGNFRTKLKPRMIEQLDAMFAEEQAFFGYVPAAP